MNRSMVVPGICSILLIGACASPGEVLKNGAPATFESTKSAQGLTTCIDRNTDGWALNSLNTNTKMIGPDSFEIVVRNAEFVHSVVQVSASKGGATASFRFGGVAMSVRCSLDFMTKGCD